MAIPFDPNSLKILLNPIPISIAPPRSPVRPTVQPSVQRIEASDAKKVINKKRKDNKDESPPVTSENKRFDFLPPGWEIKEFTRKGGKMAGSKYKYYIEPGTGQVFRSLLEVQRHLGICDTPKKPRGCTKNKRVGEATINGKEEEKIKA